MITTFHIQLGDNHACNAYNVSAEDLGLKDGCGLDDVIELLKKKRWLYLRGCYTYVQVSNIASVEITGSIGEQ